jgi:hypothetical protein
MAITDATFDNEQELQTWAFANGSTFFGDSLLLPGFRITTPSGKHGVPDGFAFNLAERSWWLVECELLGHGVWPHIAEQITRFVVAAHNSSTLRQVRDKLFETIIEKHQQEAVARLLQTDTCRLLQQLELFVEGVSPSLAIFIDNTNQDLIDCCDALDIPTQIYRVKKFIVNGRPEYYSPDKNMPIVAFDNEAIRQQGSAVFDAIEQLGGGEVVSSRNKCYRLHDGRIVKAQYSKFHDTKRAFWYGINPVAYQQVKSLGCTHFLFIIGDEGFVLLPLDIVDSYLQTANTSTYQDGSVRHYHVYISPAPNTALVGNPSGAAVDVSPYFQAFA